MKKLFTRAASGIVGIALAVGVGVAINAQKTPTKVRAEATAGIYEKVTSVAVGDRVIFVNAAGTYALGDLTATSSGYGTRVEVSVVDSKITLLATTTVVQFVVEAGATSGFAFKSQNGTNFGGQYMSYNNSATSGSNYLARYATNVSGANTQAQFNLTYSTDHMKINSVYNTGRYMRYNNDRFACYYKADGEATTGTGVDIWKYTGAPADVSPESIACNSQTVEVTGTVDLASKVTFLPANTTEKELTFAVKEGDDYIDLENGVVTGVKSGSAIVTVSPVDTSAGATAIDVAITVTAIPASNVVVGEQYVMYSVDTSNVYQGELISVSGNSGQVAQITGDVPSCTYKLTAEEGYFENTIALCDSDGKYIALTGDTNALHLMNSVEAKSSWIIQWNSSTNAATITHAVYTSRNIYMNWNNGSPKIAAYKSNYAPMYLYHYVVKTLEDFTLPEEINVYKTGTVTVPVTYDPADAADKDLEWTSGDETIATVDEHGVVTGVAVGETTITASKTINEVLVERTCTVHVLNNVSTHRGTNADPFDVADAIQVAKGVFTEDPDGTAISLSNSYYVKGQITNNVNRTTSTLTFWIGDNESQINAGAGGFEIYKVKKVYGVDLGTAYSQNSEVTRDFNIGDKVVVYSTLTVYNGTPETNTDVADVTYSNYIEARKYAEAFNTALSGVCVADGSTVLEDLVNAWGTQAGLFADLDADAQAVLTNTEVPVNVPPFAAAVILCAQKYDYIAGKYNTQLGGEYDFMGRNPTPIQNGVYFGLNSQSQGNGNTMIIIVSVIAAVSALSIGALLVIKKRKHN